jgi:hypothetical protein
MKRRVKMPNLKRRLAKPKPMSPKCRKKKQPKVELVSKCDHCGKPFGRTKAGMTYARTECSVGIMGVSNGLYASKSSGRWELFCSLECRKAATSLK